MAFLQPDIVPAMAEAICRQLSGSRGSRLSEESLAAMVVPPGMSKGTIGEKYFGDTLRELASVGAVQIADGQVSLSRDAAGANGSRSTREFVRSITMRAEVETDLWEEDQYGSLLLLGARDLVRALAWFLSLDVLSGPYAYDTGPLALSALQEQHTGKRLIFNRDRWHPFVRWSRYLGFAREISLYSGSGKSEAALLPDPTDAVRAALAACAPTGEWVPMAAIITGLSRELPVLDEGVYRRAIHEQGAPEPTADCSPSLTLAFERLAARGEIEFDVGAGDAEKVVLANNRGAFHALRITGAKQ